ncbi:hypothetical protein MJO28_016420 [Puccinia striiformis f. sp. tritici]|uniref:Uncharacterized protein n=1 Tax=Puccinia striiformis f. sp. tritici TaxID=168172 RepID=A0ACC0DP95_9BASI|nr:hypothetical protein MJO28_016420 [Puccinia striiformis f. sp. tritici]
MTSTNLPKRHKNNTSRMSTSEPPDPNENNQRDEYEKKEEDKNENKNKNKNQIDAPEEDDEASGGRQPLTDDKELSQRTYNNSVSACYKSYEAPELSEQKDKAGRRMIAYQCKLCGGKISRPTHDTSCGNLNKHVATCLHRQSEASTTQSFMSLGITATGLINPKEALVDASHKAILHPTVLKHLPTRKAVSKDIHLLYSAIQDDYRSVLKAHKGALYLGVDAWQLPNGFDILGIVIYRLKDEEKGDFELEAMPLDFVQLCESHSGKYMAQTAQMVVEKFGIQDKFPYEASLARGEEAILVQDGDSTKDDSIGDESACLGEEDIEHGSDKDKEGNRYTSKSCKETLAKFCAIAKKLRFSPNSKAEFVDICRKKGCLTPHNIERDVRTRWNSTHAQLKSAIRCEPAILKWQRHKKYGVACKHYMDKSDFGSVCDLVKVLNVFHKITLQVSIASLARLLNVVVFIDQVTYQLSTAISNQKYPPALRNACQIGLKITNKYYSLTDSSPLYRIAILLHPSFRDEYFKMANWEPDWIAEAIRLAWDMWVSHYKPQSSTTPSATPTTSTRPVTGLLAGLSSAAAARGGNSATDPFDTWLAGALVLHEGAPVNPLKWWIKQKRSGNTHGGLVEMALDVLSCPATSVDMERLFSFGSNYVTSRRRLAPESVSRGMAVAFYSKNNKIAPGVLADWKDGLKLIKKANQKGKRKLIVVDDN